MKEVIELLKKALKEKSKIEPDYSEHTIKLAADMMMVYIEEALALLREPCGTCGGKEWIPGKGKPSSNIDGVPNRSLKIPCPDCQGSDEKGNNMNGYDGDAISESEQSGMEMQDKDEPAEKPPASELKLDECEIFLMNNEILNPIGDFKAKIMVVCPNEEIMDKIEEHLKKCDHLDAAEAEIEDYKNAEKFALDSPCDEVHCGCVPLLLKVNQQLEAKLKQQGEQNEALMNRPASIECPKCHTIIKAV